ncbi:alpha/beta hydrolase [Pseudonocardiaceae bacterium YIM PH 21723]|nr:alpha/beta hydrolase [Pseudonocardiaceae bacterium YIM PH 21723]
MTARVEQWRAEGRLEEVDGHRIFVRLIDGPGPTDVFFHGYPSSSYDWRTVLPLLSNRVLLFDFLGFGLSDKPRDHVYSLLYQADLVERLLERFVPGPFVVVAHDLGTSVANELMARGLTADVLLFNGSMVLEKASPTLGQKLLRSRFGPLAARLTTQASFRFQFGRVFTPDHPLTAAEADDQWALLTHQNGHRILDKLIYYLHERVWYADRWHGAIRDWPGRLELAWALRDPVATTRVLDAMLELRPQAPVTRLPELGHYPQLDDPVAIADIINRFVATAETS